MATIEINKNLRSDLTTLTVKGEITADEIKETILAHNQAAVTKYVLWDLGQATAKAIQSSEIGSIVHATQEFTKSRKGGKTAIVASSDINFGLSRMYDILHELSHSDVPHMTFHSKEEALKWLTEKEKT